MKNFSSIIQIGLIILFFAGCKKNGDSVPDDGSLLTGQSAALSDIDGNTYKTLAVGTQIWMAENLKTTKYNDGTAVPIVTDNTAWEKLSTPAYCWYNNNVANKNTYGALYNYYTLTSGKLCPTGWHVPNPFEWLVLVQYVGEGLSANRLKEAGTKHWLIPNKSVTNDTGFTALPGGYRGPFDGLFFDLGDNGIWWAAPVIGLNNAYGRRMGGQTVGCYEVITEKGIGLSVRCLKD